MAGAVDLAAVKARSDAAARAADAPPPAAGEYVIDVSEADFQTAVIDRSFQVPVLIDLWAEWCQPCKQLSPVLEKLANEAAGAWVLAKIDVDANPRIQQALQVQSIPSVFAVLGGQLVPGFQGALPEAQVREFVDAVLQAGADAGLTGTPPGAGSADELSEPAEPAVPDDPRFDAAEEALADGDYPLAKQRFQAILDVEPANGAAALALRQVDLLARVDAAGPRVGEPAATDAEGQLAAADAALVSGDADGALRRLLDLLTATTGDEQNSARERLIEYFEILGPDDPRVGQARREMARALF